MTSRWKKVWADFWTSKSRTVLTIVIIAVGTFAVGASNNLRLFMSENMDGDYLSARPSEATIYTSPLENELVKIARRVPGVDAVEGRSTLSANLIHSDGRPISIQFTSLEDPGALTLNLLKPAKGEAELPRLGDRQMLVDASVAILGYASGDTVTIELSSGKHRELTVAGYVHDITSIPYGQYGQTVYAYVTPDTLVWLGGSRSYNALVVSVAGNEIDRPYVVGVAQAVAERMERAGATVSSIFVLQPGHYFAWDIAQGIFFLISALGYMSVFLSAFLIINTVTALMARQTRQIGIMKSVGGGTLQIFGMYLVLIILFGLVALGIAIPLADRVAEFIGTGMAESLNFYTLPYQSYPETIIQQVIVALVIPLLAVILPIYHSVRVTVREALTDYGLGASTKHKDHSISKVALWIPRPIRLSLRNVFRRKKRLALTMFTLVLGGSIFIGVYNMWASFDKVLHDIQGYYISDVTISFGRYHRFDEVASMALCNPEISSVEGWLEYSGTLITDEEAEGTEVRFVAPPSTSTLIVPLISAGRWVKPGDENAIVVGTLFLNMFPETKIGDRLTIKIDDRDTTWRIVGFYTITGNNAIPLLYVNYEHLSHLVGRPGQVYSLRVLTHQHDPVTQSRVADELRTRYKAHGIQVTDAYTAAENLASSRGITSIVVYFMTVMAVLIALVGGLGLMSTMSINVMERTREIGVMRAIGASNGNIQAIVIVEGLVIGLLSWVISLLLSVPITGVLTYGVGVAILGSPMAAVYDFKGILIWLIFTIVLATLSSALPARSASRMTVKDVLAYE